MSERRKILVSSPEEETGYGDEPDAAHRSLCSWRRIFLGSQSQLPGIETTDLNSSGAGTGTGAARATPVDGVRGPHHPQPAPRAPEEYP